MIIYEQESVDSYCISINGRWPSVISDITLMHARPGPHTIYSEVCLKDHL